MNKKILAISCIVFLGASSLNASGYRIPETNTISVAKSGANIANSVGATSAYDNPANMPFLDDKSYLDFNVMYINLPSVKYTDTQNQAWNSNSKVEHFVIPTINYVSPSFFKNFRFGISLAAPGGLSKRWNDAYAKGTAEEFTLKIFELNPTIAYKFGDVFSIAAGPRVLYTDGKVKSDLEMKNLKMQRDLEGSSWDFGYNVALSFKPSEAFTFASTYRSNIDLTIKGDANMKAGALPNLQTYKGGAKVNVPLPAVLDVAIGYDFGKTAVEFVYERTFWSKYKTLDPNYDKPLTGSLGTFDKPLPRNWSDSNTFRIGISHDFTDNFTMFAGFAYDKTPANDDVWIGFELPDSDATIYSIGATYEVVKNHKLGFAYLYDRKKDREVKVRDTANPLNLNGKFENSAAHLVSISYSYEF